MLAEFNFKSTRLSTNFKLRTRPFSKFKFQNVWINGFQISMDAWHGVWNWKDGVEWALITLINVAATLLSPQLSLQLTTLLITAACFCPSWEWRGSGVRGFHQWWQMPPHVNPFIEKVFMTLKQGRYYSLNKESGNVLISIV